MLNPTKKVSKTAGKVAIGLLLCWLIPSPAAHAEGVLNLGNGAFGANRRIRSEGGFSGVRGNFDVPQFFIPVEVSSNNGVLDPDRPKYNPNINKYVANPQVLQAYRDRATAEGWTVESSVDSNRNDTKPSYYLGSGFENVTEVDAGVQWEWLPMYGQPMGWSLFISNNGTYGANPRFSIPGTNFYRNYRAGPGTVNSGVEQYLLEHTVTPTGDARLAVTSSGTGTITDPIVLFDWKPTFDGPNINVYNNEQIPSLTVKRVVAMTQTAAPVLDGSWMQGCYFSNGELQAHGETNWRSWVLDDVNTDESGYFPGRSVTFPLENDKDNGFPRKFKVDFPGLTYQARSVNPQAEEANIRQYWHNSNNVSSRYQQELVEINLRNGAVVQGSQLEPGILTVTPNTSGG